MTHKEKLQNIIATLIKEHGKEYGLKLENVERDDDSIDVRLKGQFITLQII